MAGNDGAASIHGVCMRVSALDATGVPATGLSYYVSNSLTQVQFNPDIDSGPEIVDRNAAGQLAVTWKQMDVAKRLTMIVEIMTPDPELEAILSGGTTFVSGTNVVGMQYPPVMVEGVPNGVAIEVWTRAIKNGLQIVDYPYMHWVFPSVKLRKSNRTIDMNRMASSFEGYGFENPQFGMGPAHNIPYDTSRVAQWYRDTTYPSPVLGAQKIV